MILGDKILFHTVLPFIPHSVTPNHVTIFRFATIPLIILLLTTGHVGYGLVLFSISALSDAVDGALARTRNQVTSWGKAFDPLADKLLIGSTGVIILPKLVGLPLTLAILLLEGLILLNAYRKYGDDYKEGNIPQADKVGKIKMILQSLGVGVALLYLLFPLAPLILVATWLLYAAIVFALISLFVYNSI